MSESPYRDDDAALREKRAQLLEARTAELAHADRIVTVLADRVARTAASFGALVPLAIFQALLATSPEQLATPSGATSLARALIAGSALLSSVLYIVSRRLALTSGASLHTRIVETNDVDADVERLRVPIDVAPLERHASRLEATALVAPVFAICAAPIVLFVAARMELLARHPLRIYMMETGPVFRRMSDVEAIANTLTGSAVLVALSWIAFAVAAWHLVARQLLGSAKSQASSAATFFGAVLLGAQLAQLATNGLEEDGASVVLGYAGIAVGMAVGLLGARKVFSWAKRTFARERAALSMSATD